MRLFLAPLKAVKKHETRKRQVRAALHMLSASGVLRPGHVEVRYATPISRKTLGPHQPVRPAKISQPAPSPVLLWSQQVQSGMRRLRYWVSMLRPTVLQTGE